MGIWRPESGGVLGRFTRASSRGFENLCDPSGTSEVRAARPTLATTRRTRCKSDNGRESYSASGGRYVLLTPPVPLLGSTVFRQTSCL